MRLIIQTIAKRGLFTLTEGTNQGLFIIIAVIIFGIFVAMSYLLFRDRLSPALSSTFKDSTETVSNILNGNISSGDNNLVYEDWVKEMESKGYEMATDEDFLGDKDGEFSYIGEKEKVIIPKVIKGVTIESTNQMFTGKDVVVAVAINNPNIKSMKDMFYSSYSTTLDLSNFYTENVEDMSGMFSLSSVDSLDLSSFDTKNVKTMKEMFYDSFATTINVSSFDTKNVEDMSYMFSISQATSLDVSRFNTSNVTTMYSMFSETVVDTLDLSSFDMNNVTNTDAMFANSEATTGYAKTSDDAEKLNVSKFKPASLVFGIK